MPAVQLNVGTQSCICHSLGIPSLSAPCNFAKSIQLVLLSFSLLDLKQSVCMQIFLPCILLSLCLLISRCRWPSSLGTAKPVAMGYH